ncbi:MAG: BadF/BadG/BcrA/BcrD ATPase family protein [Candidatus Limnocylindria bacterium]
MSLLLGIDGGNSKAIAIVARRDGTIVGSARGLGAADIYAAAGEDAAIALVERTVDEALGEAGATRAEVGRAVFSMAGADWPEDFALLSAAFGAWRLGGPLTVVNDGIGALAGAVPEGPAVVVSIGTGAATGARGLDGRTWHSSFWQSPQGAGELAQRMLAAVVRSDLELQPPTALRERILAITGDATVEAVLHRFTARGGPPLPIGRMVRALLAEADDGDAVAAGVVRDHGAGFGGIAAAAARQVGIAGHRYALSFCGGLSRSGAALGTAAVEAVRAAGQSPVLVPPRWEPAIGALVIGLGAEGSGMLAGGVAERLDATAPPPSLYEVPGA